MEIVSFNQVPEECFKCQELVQPKVGLKLSVCKHCICKRCLRSVILDGAGTPRLKCPREGCEGTVLLSEIKSVLSKQEYLSYLGASGRLKNQGASPNLLSNKFLNPSSRKGSSVEEGADSLDNILRGNCPVQSELSSPDGSIPGTNKVQRVIESVPSSSSIVVEEIQQSCEINPEDSLSQVSEPLRTVFKPEDSNCGFCGVNLKSGEILLQACHHIFCKECLQEAVGGSSGGTVSCPAAGCAQELDIREIKGEAVAPALASPYEKYSGEEEVFSLSGKDLPIFQCKTPGCDGLCIPENNARIFLCDICNRQNCMRCETIHDGIPCDRWKQIRLEANLSGQGVTDEELLARSEDFGYKQISRTVQELRQGFPKDNLDLYYDAAGNSYQGSSVLRIYEDFECLICTNMTSEEETGGGFLLQTCGHAFCRSCLESIVNLAEDIQVPCPYDGEGGRCKEFLTPAEFKDLASEDVFEKHIRWGWSIAEDILQKKFRCLERTCEGFWEIEDKSPIGIYVCPVCRSENCVRCNTLHRFQTCAEFQEELRKEAQRIKDDENRKVQQENEQLSEAEVNKRINARQYMRCPYCNFVCEKIDGCNHMVCLNRGCKQKFNWYS